MRSRCHTPAVALKSVAFRYGHRQSSLPLPLASRSWLLGNRQDRSALTSPEDTIEAKMRRIEAVLFLAREPLSSRKMSQYANLADGTEARTLVRRLNERLEILNRAFRVQEVAGGFQLTTRAKFAKWLRRLEHVPSHIRLSAPSMETLAVVAFRQPVIRAEIEAIRGVSCGDILHQLMNRDLVRVGGRSDELGRPYLYNTTKQFLQVFGLRSLDDLPKSDRFCTAPVRLPPEPSVHELKDPETTGSVVEEESDVSVSVQEEKHPSALPAEIESDRISEREVRLEDEDFDDDEEEYEYVDEEVEDDDDEYEDADDEELEDEELEDEELEDEELEEEELEEEELEEEIDDDDVEYEDADEDEDEFEDEDAEDDGEDLDEDIDEYEEVEEEEEEVEEDADEEGDGFEDDEWEEVEEDEEEEDWEDDDWEDDDEWEEDETKSEE